MTQVTTIEIDPKKLKGIFKKYEIKILTEPRLDNDIYYFDAERLGTKLKISIKKSTIERSDKFNVWIKGVIDLFNEMSRYKKFDNGF